MLLNIDVPVSCPATTLFWDLLLLQPPVRPHPCVYLPPLPWPPSRGKASDSWAEPQGPASLLRPVWPDSSLRKLRDSSEDAVGAIYERSYK